MTDEPKKTTRKRASRPAARKGQDKSAEGRKARRWYTRKRVIIPAAVVLAAAIGVFLYWYFALRPFVSTDDSFVDSHQIVVSTKMMGRVVELGAHEGDAVQQGQLLVRLSDDVLQAQKTAAEADVNQAQRAAKVAAVKLKLAEDDFRRTSEQFRMKAVSRARFDTDQKALEMARAAYHLAEVQIEVAKARLGIVEAQLTDTRVAAPQTGVVAKKWIMPGDVVQPGQPIFTLYDLHDIWITANFDETKMAGIRLGSRATISVDAYPDLQLSGEVILIGAATASQFSLIPPNNASGNFTKVAQRVPVRISVPVDQPAGDRTSQRLVPGLSVEVSIRTE